MKYLVCVSLLLFLFACSEDSNQEEKLEIMPLAIGNYWGFDVIDFNEDGTIKDTSIYIISLRLDTVINNKKYYYTLIDNFLHFSNDNGLYINNLQNPIKDWLFLKYPCSIGDTWEYNLYFNSNVSVNSLNKLVSVPYGTFECIEYEFSYFDVHNINDTVYTQYYVYAKPGFGITLEKEYNKLNYDGEYKLIRKFELVESNLN